MAQSQERGDYATDDESLCEFLDDDLREQISEIAEARGQMSGGVVKAGVKRVLDTDEGRIIDFRVVDEARAYYRKHKKAEREFSGAYNELSGDGYYERPGQELHETLNRKGAIHREKANAAARWLDKNADDVKVVTGEFGQPEAIPQIDKKIEVQHGE